MRTIYFDYNATTPLDPVVREAMLPFLEENWGNPSSIHHVGRKARAMLDEFRERAASHLRCKNSEIVFTSGGTESVNLAILGTARRLKTKGRHIVTSAIEHHAVLHACRYLQESEGFEVTLLPVDRKGRVDPDSVRKALRPQTILVSIMAANNEIGTIQPFREIGTICREKGVLFHTDAVQWFGKEPFDSVYDFNADLVSMCAHKFHGPKGSGALFIRSPFRPEPILLGGSHEDERRAGTENLAGIAGLVRSIELFTKPPVFLGNAIKPLTDNLLRCINKIEQAHFVGSIDCRINNTLSFIVNGTDSMAILAGLDLEGVCASSGSACSAGSLEPSHVISALGYGEDLANALIRFSLGRENTLEEVEHVISVLPEIIRRAQPSK